MSNELAFHPFANIFPLSEGEELRALAESIRASGVREPITLHEGLILDGRNRYRAARIANLGADSIPTRVFDPEKKKAIRSILCGTRTSIVATSTRLSVAWPPPRWKLFVTAGIVSFKSRARILKSKSSVRILK